VLIAAVTGDAAVQPQQVRKSLHLQPSVKQTNRCTHRFINLCFFILQVLFIVASLSIRNFLAASNGMPIWILCLKVFQDLRRYGGLMSRPSVASALAAEKEAIAKQVWSLSYVCQNVIGLGFEDTLKAEVFLSICAFSASRLGYQGSKSQLWRRLAYSLCLPCRWISIWMRCRLPLTSAKLQQIQALTATQVNHEPTSCPIFVNLC